MRMANIITIHWFFSVTSQTLLILLHHFIKLFLNTECNFMFNVMILKGLFIQLIP